MTFQLLKLTIWMLIGLALSGCLSSILPDARPADSVYRLNLDYEPAVKVDNAVVVRIDRPVSQSNLNTTGIILSPDGRRLAFAPNAQWVEPIPTLIQSSLFKSLRASPNITPVLPSGGARPDYRLNLTIQKFEAAYDKGEEFAPTVKLQYVVSLINSDTRRLLDDLAISESVPAQANSVSSIVQAKERAQEQALMKIRAWLDNITFES